MSHRHFDEADPRNARVGPCRFRTRKECDENFADWQAVRQVKLAQRIVDRGDAKMFRKDMSEFGQLVQLLAGDRENIMTQSKKGKGNVKDTAFTRRLMRAVDTLAKKGS